MQYNFRTIHALDLVEVFALHFFGLLSYPGTQGLPQDLRPRKGAYIQTRQKYQSIIYILYLFLFQEDRSKEESELKPELRRTESPVTRKNVSSMKRQNSTSSGSRSEGSLSSLAEEVKLPEPEAEPEKSPRKFGGKKKLDLKGKLGRKGNSGDKPKLATKKTKKEQVKVEPSGKQDRSKADLVEKEEEDGVVDKVEDERMEDEDEIIHPIRKSSRTGKIFNHL